MFLDSLPGIIDLKLVSFILLIGIMLVTGRKTRVPTDPEKLYRISFSYLFMLLINLVCIPVMPLQLFCCSGGIMMSILAGNSYSFLFLAVTRFLIVLVYNSTDIVSAGFNILLVGLLHCFLGYFIYRKITVRYLWSRILIPLAATNIIILLISTKLSPVTRLPGNSILISIMLVLMVSLFESLISSFLIKKIVILPNQKDQQDFA